MDSLNYKDETVHQKLLFLFPKHFKTRLQQCRNLKLFRGSHPRTPRFQSGKRAGVGKGWERGKRMGIMGTGGRPRGEGKSTWRSAPSLQNPRSATEK